MLTDEERWQRHRDKVKKAIKEYDDAFTAMKHRLKSGGPIGSELTALSLAFGETIRMQNRMIDSLRKQTKKR